MIFIYILLLNWFYYLFIQYKCEIALKRKIEYVLPKSFWILFDLIQNEIYFIIAQLLWSWNLHCIIVSLIFSTILLGNRTRILFMKDLNLYKLSLLDRIDNVFYIDIKAAFTKMDCVLTVHKLILTLLVNI